MTDQKAAGAIWQGVGGAAVTAVDPVPVEARLRDIQSITDAALSRLDGRELLVELLDRMREILQVDTAAVLLLDAPSGQLIATAAAGLEEEVRQGVRIPVGGGFAGRIAAERRPVILDHVDHTTVFNPILWAKGIRSMMGVPMVAGGKLIGVLSPVIALPGQPAELVRAAPGLMIGIKGGVQRPVTTVAIPPATLLCFYTDGLIERPGQVIDDGLARLCQVVSAQPPEAVCVAVMGALIGSEPARDDVALLMIRRQVWPDPPGNVRRETEHDSDA